MARRLDNYLRTYRKRTALSQDEVAYLLGSSRGGVNVSRYERGTREPSLETAMALAWLFRTPVRELFAGRSHKVERSLRRRAAALSARLARAGASTPTARRKLEALAALSSPST